MTNAEAAQLLRMHNAWRRAVDDDTDYAMADPKELGVAIDMAVEALRESKP